MMRNRLLQSGTIGKMGAWLVLLHVAFLPAVAAESAQGPCLTLKPAVVVDQDAVCLSDIATLTGAPQNQLDELGALPVARSPQPGKTRFLGSDYIRIRLKQAGVDIDALVFKGPRDVRITREAAILPGQDLVRAIEAEIRNRMPWKNEDVTISGISFDEKINLPTGRLTYRIEPTRNEDYLGRTILSLHLFVDGKPVRKIWVHASIAVMANVVTAIRPLGKHQTIERADLVVERRDLSDLPSSVVYRLEDAVGNRVTRMVYPNTVLQTDMVSLPPLVKRGDIVKIVAGNGFVTITATGMVKQKGCKGEMVRVMNTDSNRIVTARVTGPGAVEVDF